MDSEYFSFRKIMFYVNVRKANATFQGNIMQCHAKISSMSNYESTKNGPKISKEMFLFFNSPQAQGHINNFFIPNFDLWLYPYDKCTKLIAFPKKINM